MTKRVACYDCGRPYGGPGWIEAIIPDAIWEEISPTHNGGRNPVHFVHCRTTVQGGIQLGTSMVVRDRAVGGQGRRSRDSHSAAREPRRLQVAGSGGATMKATMINLLIDAPPYEGFDIIGAFESKADAETRKANLEKRLEAWERKQRGLEKKGDEEAWCNGQPHNYRDLCVYSVRLQPAEERP